MYKKLFDSLKKEKILQVKWDLKKEKLSLGGLLVLKQEMQLLKKQFSLEKIYFIIEDEQLLLHRDFITEILELDVEIQIAEKKIEVDWPLFEAKDFSYQSFLRLKFLCHYFKSRPELQWSKDNLQKAKMYRKKLPGKCFTLHLKQVNNKDSKESNASLREWISFFKEIINKQKVNFILLGKDYVSPDLLKINGIKHAESENLSLVEQLSLISISDGFLGQASGICQAAIFSFVPYVIFKHPLHHVEEMKREIGKSDSFFFANEKQKILRQLDTLKNIKRAFNFINSKEPINV